MTSPGRFCGGRAITPVRDCTRKSFGVVERRAGEVALFLSDWSRQLGQRGLFSAPKLTEFDRTPSMSTYNPTEAELGSVDLSLRGVHKGSVGPAAIRRPLGLRYAGGGHENAGS